MGCDEKDAVLEPRGAGWVRVWRKHDSKSVSRCISVNGFLPSALPILTLDGCVLAAKRDVSCSCQACVRPAIFKQHGRCLMLQDAGAIKLRAA